MESCGKKSKKRCKCCRGPRGVKGSTGPTGSQGPTGSTIQSFAVARQDLAAPVTINFAGPISGGEPWTGGTPLNNRLQLIRGTNFAVSGGSNSLILGATPTSAADGSYVVDWSSNIQINSGLGPNIIEIGVGLNKDFPTEAFTQVGIDLNGPAPYNLMNVSGSTQLGLVDGDEVVLYCRRTGGPNPGCNFTLLSQNIRITRASS